METRTENKMAAEEWISLQPLQLVLVPVTKDAAEVYHRNVQRRQKEAIQNALNKGYLKTLNRDLIVQQWQCADDSSNGEDLECVLRVSLPNSRVQALDDMALLSCSRLRLCNLPNCFVNDMAAFYGCVNLLKLDLSNNQIEHVPQGDFWFSLSSLRVLYLHGNGISSSSCLQCLNHCPHLHVLTLHSTPLSLSQNYRHHVVNGIMSLQALDEHVVSDEEIVETLSLQGSFRTLSPQLRLQLYTPYCKESGFVSELRGVYRLLLTVDCTLAHYSPVLIVQRWTRGWLTRRALAKSTDTRIRSLLSKYRFSGWSCTTAPPPPNTATTTQRPAPQVAIAQHTARVSPHARSSQRAISAQVPLPSHLHSKPTTCTIPKSFSGPNCKTTLNVPFPAPPPTSPILHSPCAHERAPDISSSQQCRATTLPLESYTLAVDPDSSRLRHSLCVNLNQLQQSAHSHGGPSTEGGQRKGSEKSPCSDKQRALQKGRHTLKREREVLQEEDGPESEGINGMVVSGQKAEVRLEDNWVEKMAQMKKENGKRVREAEYQIMENLAKVREPPSKELRRVDPPTTIHGAPRLSKNALAFSRAFESMTLSPLKAVDRIHELDRVNENWSRKAAHVSRVKMERERQRQKIKEIRQRTKETVEAWRIMEDNKVARLQDENVLKASQNLLEKSIQRNAASKSRRRDEMDRSFATEFTQQAVSIGHEMAKDDCEISTKGKREEIKERVQLLTETARQRREEARSEREIRDTRLMWEGVLAKKDLDRKIMQAAVQRMSEAKRRVERAVNRRETAKTSVARARETLKTNARQTSTLGSTLPPLRLDLRNKSELAEACNEALQMATTENTYSTFRLRYFTHEANRSWQRGARVLAEREKQSIPQLPTQGAHPPYFPTICETATPTYPMMRPGCILRSVPTPFQSEITEPSPAHTRTPSSECDCTTQPHPLGVT